MSPAETWPGLLAAVPCLTWDLTRDLHLLLQYPFKHNAFVPKPAAATVRAGG
jgi:hypothetical protein